MNLIVSGDEGLRPLVGDLTNQVLVLPHTKLNRRYQLPRFQLVKATGGFGCDPKALGSMVFGQFVADGEDAAYRRSDFIGIADAGLIGRAMGDPTPVKELDVNARTYLLITRNGTYESGDTVDQAMRRLRRLTRSAVQYAYHVHPESRINDFGFISYPDGIPPVEVKIKKQGKEWIVTS